jgi:16S rRNA (uracil1498-N3)-methyltransferase
VLIGPEGDFAPAETGMLLVNGFVSVTLGQSRLRTETAALAACTWMSLRQSG